MEDREYIESIRRAREEAVSFFSSERKPERERWVVNEFLVNLGIDVGPDEAVSSDDEPPDVIYKDAKFEVKEILDPGKRRHAEYKASLRRAENATSAADLLEEYRPRDILYSEMCALVVERLGSEKKYAPAVRRSLDLLFYVNLEGVHGYVANELPTPNEIEKFGWRSVGFIAGPLSVVLHACGDAPEFLRAVEGRVVRKVRAS